MAIPLTVTKFCVYAVKCQEPPDVRNGNFRCNTGDDEVYSYGDTCDVIWDAGYTLAGSATGICLSSGSWSGMDGTCKRGEK